MNLYRISQTERGGYDTFDAAIVAAESEDVARRIHPIGSWSFRDPDEADWTGGADNEDWTTAYPTWATHPDHVTVLLIGTAAEGTERGVILASFNAG